MAPNLSLTDGTNSLLGSITGDPPAPAPADGKPPAPAPGAEPKPADPKPAAGAPEKYEDFKVPEGVELKGEVLDKATALFKEAGLPQAVAQKFLDFHAEQLKAMAEGPGKLWQETQAVWIDELRSDPTIGKGVENGTVGASIAKMVNQLPGPLATSFREAMNFTGAGNHPAIVRGIYELSKKFAEPGHVQGNAPAQLKTKPSPAAALFPNLVPKE